MIQVLIEGHLQKQLVKSAKKFRKPNRNCTFNFQKSPWSFLDKLASYFHVSYFNGDNRTETKIQVYYALSLLVFTFTPEKAITKA